MGLSERDAAYIRRLFPEIEDLQDKDLAQKVNSSSTPRTRPTRRWPWGSPSRSST